LPYHQPGEHLHPCRRNQFKKIYLPVFKRNASKDGTGGAAKEQAALYGQYPG